MTDPLRLTSDAITGNPANEPSQAPLGSRIALWRLLFLVVLVLFVGLLAVGLGRQNRSERRATGVAPEFELTTFAGETIRLADLRGKGVVLNFWASWCVPCRAEAPLLEAAWQQERNNGIVFIGLDYLDQEHAAKAFIEEFGVTYPNGPDLQSKAARRYGIQAVPETFFIGPDGKIVSLVIGQITSAEDLAQRINAIKPPQ